MTSSTPRSTRVARSSVVLRNAARISVTVPVPPGGLNAFPPSATTRRMTQPRLDLSGQIRDADHAGLRAKLRDDDVGRGPVTATRQRGGIGVARRLDQQVARIGHAAAHNEAHWVEHRGQVCDALSEPAADLLEAVDRRRIAFGRGSGDDGTVDRVDRLGDLEKPTRVVGPFRRDLAGSAHERGATAVLLPAAEVAAPALPSRRHDTDMTGFAGESEAAAVEIAVDDEAAADAGADGQHDDVGELLAGAEPVFAPCGCVGVVLDDDRKVDAGGHLIVQWCFPPAAVRRDEDVMTGGVDESCRADPNRADLMLAQELPHDLADNIDQMFVVTTRRAPPRLRGDVAVLIHNARSDLPTTDVDADRLHQSRAASSSRTLRSIPP